MTKSVTMSNNEINVKKIHETLFWGVKLDPSNVFCNDEIKHVFNRHPHVIPLKNLHITLLYVGRTTNPNKDIITPFNYKNMYNCKQLNRFK
jgi:2'-5' RNA ligase